MKGRLFVFFLLTPLLLFPLPASYGRTGDNPWTHSFYFENDLFCGTDSNYTNGAKYSLISPDLAPDAAAPAGIPQRILDIIHRVPLIHDTPPETSHKVEFSFGQNMYTPTDTSREDLIPEDRPYAGWTYVSTSYHRKSRMTRDRSVMDTVEVQIGMVGPASLAEETQTLVHKLRKLDLPMGWDNQLSNEPGLVLAFERKWLFHPERCRKGFGHDTILHSGFTAGNVSTGLNAGAEFRLGWNIPETFGVSLIRPAGSSRMDTAESPGIYFMAALDSRLVLRNIFLDGNTFANSHSVSKKPFMASVAYGVTLNWGPFMASLTGVRTTPAFQGQHSPHSYGAICGSWFFTF